MPDRLLTSGRRSAFAALCCWLLLHTSLCVPRAAASSAAAKIPAVVASSSSSRRAAPLTGRREGEALVRFRAGVSEQQVDALVASYGLRRAGRLRGPSGVERLAPPEELKVEDLIAALAHSPLVEFVEPDFLISADQSAPDDQPAPNDPRFPEQWILHNDGRDGGRDGSDVGAVAAWSRTTGSPETVVAVVDSGIDFTHPDLRRNRWVNKKEAAQADGYADDQGGYADDLSGWDWVTDSGDVKDGHGHGTAVAGIIAARGDNGVGVTGLMWRASLMSLRVLDAEGLGRVSDAVEAIDYAVEHGARVVNLSWGAQGESEALREAIRRAGRRGVVVVCSAGNRGRNLADAPHYPASYDLPNVITAAATDSSDQLHEQSNRGRAALIAAPGVSVLTTKAGGGYERMTGTSAAAAVASGVAGLMKTVRPRVKAGRLRGAVMAGARRVEGLAGAVAAGGVVRAPDSLDLIKMLPGDADLREGEREETKEVDGRERAVVAPSPVLAAPATPPGRAGRPNRRFPNLDEARRGPGDAPRAIPPAPSTRPRCPPHDPRCGEPGGDGRPKPTPPPPPILGSATTGATRWIQVASLSTYALLSAVSAPPGVSVSPVSLALTDFYLKGYGVSDTPPAAAAGTVATVAPMNLALGKTATQSSTYGGAAASRAVDGDTNGNYFAGSVTHTGGAYQDWWQVDLGAIHQLKEIKIWNRADCCAERLTNFHVLVSNEPFASLDLTATLNQAGVAAYHTPGQGGRPTAVAANRTGRYVRVQLAGQGIMSLAEVEVTEGEAPPINLALGRAATQSSTYGAAAASRAVDGDTSGNYFAGSVTHTGGAYQDWWQVDLGAVHRIDEVKVWNRTDCCGERLTDFHVLVSDEPFVSTDLAATLNQAGVAGYHTPGQGGRPTSLAVNRAGRYVRVQLAGQGLMSLAEVEVFGRASTPRTNVALASAGALATASSRYHSGYPASAANDGDRRGLNWASGGGGWHDSVPANTFPDWLQIDFQSPKRVDEVSVFGLQDDHANPLEPTGQMTFTRYGLTAYEVQYWTGSAWATVPGGAVSGNDRVWRGFRFPAVTTSKIRVLIHATGDGYSRIVEIEAYESAASTPDAQGAGLRGDYFGDTNLAAHRLTRVDPSVDFDWGAASPDSSVGPDEFSARWSGTLTPRHSETHTFYTTTDDGVRLWVDGRLVIDRWVDQGPTEWSGQVAMEAGRAYALRMEFYENGGGARASLSWSSASQPKQVAPQSQLSPCWKQAGRFVEDFYRAALGRAASADELRDWTSRVTQARGGAQAIAEAQALGRALFQSAEYSQLNPADNTKFAFDLYRGYLQRAASQAEGDGFADAINTNGRGWAVAAMESSPEFVEKVGLLCGASAGAGGGGGAGYNFSSAGLEAANRTGAAGADSYSRNFNWSAQLVGLRGRAGLDLGLMLSYNSLVWTKDAGGVTFDAAGGFPSPGFRLGLPAVRPKFYDGRTGRPTYLLVTAAGARVGLRQVGASNLYESVDSSYLQLTEVDGGSLLLRSTDGARLTFALKNGEYKCVEVKDGNGNYLTADYDEAGRLGRVTDTLGRAIIFNYDAYRNLVSITQQRRRADGSGSDAHEYATFGYRDLTLRPSFANLAVVGAQAGATLPMLERVGLDDGSYYKFYYTAWGQVWRVTRHAADGRGPDGRADDSHPLEAVSVNLPGSGLLAASPQTDCPRFTELRTWAENWNGDEGDGVLAAEEEAVTSYTAWGENMESCEVTLPDRTTVLKEYYGVAGWRKGLRTRSDVYALSVPGAALPSAPVKRTETKWTQDDMALGYAENPRVIETNISDDAGNRRRTRIEYLTAAESPFRLPARTFEYKSDASTVWRRTETSYRPDSVAASGVYSDRHVVGLVSERRLYGLNPYTNAEELLAKVTYTYDEGGIYLDASAGSPARHDPAYGAGFVAGRGLLTGVRRWDAEHPTDQSKSTESKAGYDLAGSVVFTADALGHKTVVEYADRFSDGVSRNTRAYATAVTDPEQSVQASPVKAETTYDYDRGLVTKVKDLKGAERAFDYDAAGRLKQATTPFDGASTRYEYPAAMTYVHAYSRVDTGTPEAHSWRVFDGAGRLVGSASDHPGSAGGYSGRETYYDRMGRAYRESNPTEMDGRWEPAGDDAAAAGGGWRYAERQVDWQGRLKKVTNADGTSSEVSYAGCGCAGGQVVTATDEVGRRVRTATDALGREWKSEQLNPDGTVYRTERVLYDLRDQAVERRTHAGPAESDSSRVQQTLLTYDGHGRLATRKDPARATALLYAYNADDTLRSLTDARGVVTSYAYDRRRLPTLVRHAVPPGLTDVPATADVRMDYDAAGNRTSMTDGSGSTAYRYDALSRLEWEERRFAGLAGAYRLTYSYNLAGSLKSVTDPDGVVVNYGYDALGRLNGVTGTSYAGVGAYVSGVQYRAWGAPKYYRHGGGQEYHHAYDARLRLSGLRAGALMSSEFRHHADGRVAYVRDNLNPTLDRAYKYDPAGRLTEGLTGSEARGESAADGPYRQAYTYDEWDNLTGRPVNRLWSGGGPFAVSYDGNNRQRGVSYDADGRVTYDRSRRSHTYEAAGRKVKTSETTQASSWGRGVQGPAESGGGPAAQNVPVGGYYTTTALTLTLTYDGDGQTTRRAQTKRVSTPQYQPVETAQTEYYLRSTVMGGRVITELDGTGRKAVTKVYAWGGQEVAEQRLYSGGQQGVVWKHANPVTNAKVEQNMSNGLTQRKEYDPWGLELGDSDPYLVNAEPDYASLAGGSFYREGGNPFDGGGGCQWDGVPVMCEMLGVIGRARGGRVVDSRRGTEAAAAGASGGGHVWVDAWEDYSAAGDPSNPADGGTVGARNAGYFVAVAGASPLGTTVRRLPQYPESLPVDVDNIRRGLAWHLVDPKCASFISDLLNRVSTGDNPLVAKGDILDIFDAVRGLSGIVRDNSVGGGEARGSVGGRNAQMVLAPTRFGGNHTPSEKARIQLGIDIRTALHETIHFAGVSVYSDRALALAVQAMTGREAPGPTGRGPLADAFANSAFWDKELRKHCRDTF